MTLHALFVLAAAALPGVAPALERAPRPVPTAPLVCPSAGPDYYAIDLVSTKNVPGTGLARGTADVTRPGDAPFPVAVAADGSYAYRIDVSIERAKVPPRGRLVAWVTTPELDRVRRIGALDEELRAGGTVAWNKFLVVITLEPGDDPSQARWSGPVAFRGMSRSGMMHTMVGHGAFQQENCAAYGY